MDRLRQAPAVPHLRRHELPGQGPNAIGAWLGDGWYRGRLGFNGGTRNIYGTDQSWLAQLEIAHDDGTTTTIATDASWQAATGPIITSSLYDGEVHDARAGRSGLVKADGANGGGMDAGRGARARPGYPDPGGGPAGPLHRNITPVTALRRDDGSYLLDFGQNLVGRLAITVERAARHVT